METPAVAPIRIPSGPRPRGREARGRFERALAEGDGEDRPEEREALVPAALQPPARRGRRESGPSGHRIDVVV